MASWRARGTRPPWWRLSRAGVADEATAFLQGELLEQLYAGGSGWRAPAWVWLNAVAHGDLAQLQEIAGTGATEDEPILEWAHARSALARELIARAEGDPAAVQRLQRGVLMRLEQNLNDATDLTPARLYQIAVDEMRLIGT